MNSAVPVTRMGKRWEASTLLCASSSTRLSSTANFLVQRWRGVGRLAAGIRQLLASLPDLFGLRAVLLFQAVQPLYDLPQIGLPRIRRRGLRR